MSEMIGFTSQRLANVWAVVVAYHPDAAELRALCARLGADGAKVVVVDNTESPRLVAAELPAGTKLHSLYSNTGVAHAQNVGITAALDGGAQTIVFFDQDSTFDADFLSLLIGALRPGTPDIVSPLCLDIDTRTELPSQRLAPFGRVRPVYCSDAKAPILTDIVISSGTAATREALALAGDLDEDLFIDFVDTEWCLRCRSKDIPIRVVPGAVMYHRIGIRSLAEGPLTITIHSPTRCYYQIRNSIHLFRRHHIPRLFAVREFAAVMLNRLLLLRHVNNRTDYLKAYAQGFRDGLLGVVGIRKIH